MRNFYRQHRLLFSVLLLTLIFSQSAVAQMRRVSLSNTVSYINSLSFFSADSGYVVFQFSGILKFSSDSGHNFTDKPITIANTDKNGYGSAAGFFIPVGTKAFNFDSLLVYGSYDSGPAMLLSVDRGNSFKIVYYNNTDTAIISSVVFPENNNIGFAVVNNRIIRTADRGQNWSSVFLTPNTNLTFIEALDNNSLVAFSTELATPKMVKTNNSGASWNTVSIPTGRIGYSFFITPNKGWLSMTNAADSAIYFTSNGGISWQRKNNAAATPFASRKIIFTNDSTGFAIGRSYKIYKTIDL